jgi:protein-disulfide isomerase
MAHIATDIRRPARVPDHTNADGDGVAVGTGPVVIDAYEDFLCPFCRMFEERSGATLHRLVDEELATVVYHPLGFLDRASTTAYSSRAAAASGCAADRGRFLAFHDILYANQPPEAGPGLSDEELIALGAQVGLTDDGFATCVTEHAHLPWVAYVTERAIARGVSGTPTVMVEGVNIPANREMIVAAVSAAMDARG